jgi:hypothetical protein
MARNPIWASTTKIPNRGTETMRAMRALPRLPISEKVQDWGAQASEAVRQTGTQIADKTASVADRASATLHDAGDAAATP